MVDNNSSERRYAQIVDEAENSDGCPTTATHQPWGLCLGTVGIRSAFTVQALKGQKKKYDPDLVFLMETKNEKEKVEK